MVAPGEPTWSDSDRGWALALAEIEADTCSGCGQSRSESTAPENEFSYSASPLRCHACAASDRGARKFTSQGASPERTDGLLWQITKKP